ncbi:MAG: alternative ribosome rescue aminoacyl-tRNA hydrolase ArfB [Cyclobacteriaceae bacterium]
MDNPTKLSSEYLLPEISFQASRSGGPGGQHVNKVNTKVTLKWDVAGSELIDEGQRERLMIKLTNVLTKEGVLVMTAQTSKSQLRNKAEVLDKLDRLLEKAFARSKPRRRTKPTYSSVKKRLESKKRQAEKKNWRKKL